MKLSTLFLITIFSSALYLQQPVDAVDKNTGNNVCNISKKTLFDGTQNPNGECVTTVMGEIPDKQHMVSSLIISPTDGQTIQAKTTFTVKSKVINLSTGNFDDPAKQYYKFPQTLDANGLVQGHSHITIQDLGNEQNPPDPQVFAFFKGLNDPAQNGVLSVDVTGGLAAGRYRICTMTASFAHQPTLMPIAQRGSQDDCIRVTVAGAGGKTPPAKTPPAKTPPGKTPPGKTPPGKTPPGKGNRRSLFKKRANKRNANDI